MRLRFARKITALACLLLLASLDGGLALADKETPAPEKESFKARAAKWRELETITEEDAADLEFQQTFPDKVWWERFQDPHLTAYIQKAVNGNLNLEAAYQRILEARALARQSLGAEFPQVSLGSSFSRSRNSATIIRTPRIGAQQGSGASSGGSGFALGQAINNYSTPLSVSYEVDIWGKNRKATQALNKQADAVESDFQSVHVIVATEVANAYFNLLAADRLIELQNEVIDLAEADLAHAQRLFEAGVSDEENVVLRQGRLTDCKARLQDFHQLQALALNQMAVLMGQTTYQVANLERARWEDYRIPTEISAGVPSDLLTRRPDIRAAEERLVASGLQVQVARKEMLPSINLIGQFGFASASVGDLFKWESYIASAASSLLQTVFTGGQKRANLRVHKARYEQQVLAYRDTILQAFREVDDSLASLKAHHNAYSDYSESLHSLQQRLRIQQNRLDAGAIAEADMNPVRLEAALAQESLAHTKLAALTDVLSLYKALGGGY